jgi:hypothetical protein
VPKQLLRFQYHSNDDPRTDARERTLMMVNSRPWMGKEAGTCMVEDFDLQCREGGIERGLITVRYRPHGWAIRRIARTDNGCLADEQGNPLPEGQEPVFLEFEVYPRTDFNDLNFGIRLPEREEAVTSSP